MGMLNTMKLSVVFCRKILGNSRRKSHIMQSIRFMLKVTAKALRLSHTRHVGKFLLTLYFTYEVLFPHRRTVSAQKI